MLRPIRRVALTAALGTTLALAAGTASASAATTIGDLPDSAPLVNKLYVPVALTVSCDPDPYYPMPGYGSVTIRQVVAGKQIAHGTATVGSMTCDGVAHEYIVNVFPDSGSTISPPFAKGDAVISAQVSAGTGYDSAGPEEIRLGR